jgi:flagellar motility protein MotE (MotC chaperone)
MVAAAATLAVASTMALAQQGWETTVTGSSLMPRRGATPWATVAASVKPKAVPPSALTAEAAPPADGKAVTKAAASPLGKSETSPTKGTEAEEYCANIASPAADARFVWQKKVIADMEQEIAKRIAALEEKTADLQKWLARREAFSKKANETLLSIYSRMRPDAAAVQLAGLDEETAAALLIKLEPRKASLILNEMDSSQAIRLSATISGAAKVTPPAPPKTPPEAKAK